MKMGQVIFTQDKYGKIINVEYDPPDADVFEISKEMVKEFVSFQNYYAEHHREMMEDWYRGEL